MSVLGPNAQNLELAKNFRASKSVQARDRSADPPRARPESRSGTDAMRELKFAW